MGKGLELGGFVERVKDLHLYGITVSRDGETVGEYLWEPDIRRNVYSASKSFTATAVGIAIDEGLLSLEEPLTECFPDKLPEEVSENLRRAKVRDLLTMCLGQASPSLMGEQRPRMAEEDWVAYALAQPFADAPGTRFVYNNVGPYLAGMLVKRRSGEDLLAYLETRLFKPLGIRKTVWEVDPLGNTFGAGGLFLTMEELHKLGLLYLQEGMYGGTRIVSADWTRECMKPQADNGTPYGYGYLFWGGEHGSFRADGKYCQLSIVLRRENAVITVTADCRNWEALNRAIFDELYPQLAVGKDR